MNHRHTFARMALPLAAIALAAAVPQVARAEDAPPPAPQETFAVHGQATLVAQAVTGFASPYSSDNSLAPGQTKETFDATLYLGVQPWRGAELWANPEIDQGFGLSNTLGVAGFPSAEAYKVGKSSPYFRLQRLFLRQTVSLGADRSAVAGAANQLAGSQSANRLVLTVGKFGVGDVFDTNRYAHDPRGDFLNWALVDTGSFDYAADAWGYSYGAAAELYRGSWTLRLGAFNLSKVPNGEVLETGFEQSELDAEIEHRHTIGGHAGAVRLAVFRNHGRFARLDEAVAAFNATGTIPDLATLRRPATRLGGQLNIEQEVTGTLGLFLRAGVSDGRYEAYDFTDIDRTLAVGASLGGKGWHREADRIGLATVVNGISKARERYLADGGLGILIGDGALPHPGEEWITEAYYSAAVAKGFALSADYQRVVHPGYNRDRGPANVLAVRLHGAF
jgi:high affinity Mn2+ porin